MSKNVYFQLINLMINEYFNFIYICNVMKYMFKPADFSTWHENCYIIHTILSTRNIYDIYKYG